MSKTDLEINEGLFVKYLGQNAKGDDIKTKLNIKKDNYKRFAKRNLLNNK